MGFPNLRYLDLFRLPAPYINCLELKAVIATLHHCFSAPGPPGFDRYGQYNSSFLYKKTRRDPFPNLVASSSGPYVATSSGQSSQSQAHPRLFEHDSGPPIQTQSADIDRVESPFRSRESNFLGDSISGHVCHSPQYPPTSVHVSNSGTSSTSSGCSVSGLAAGEINLHAWRPSTNRMYDDRWLCFTLGAVQHKTISDMISSMELQRPRVTPVLPQWDLGYVLEALCKPPYEPLQEASLKCLRLSSFQP